MARTTFESLPLSVPTPAEIAEQQAADFAIHVEQQIVLIVRAMRDGKTMCATLPNVPPAARPLVFARVSKSGWDLKYNDDGQRDGAWYSWKPANVHVPEDF